MSRQARQRSITDIYHVIQRGIDRMVIFRDDDDRQMFLNLLRLQVCESFKIYCYCLMDNHIHLLVKSDRLSFHIHHIASIYAMWFNHKYNRRGYLFQDRFKSEVIEDEGYLLRCFRYILRNPVKAGICEKIEIYGWSSYHLCFGGNGSFVVVDFLPCFFETKKDFQTYLQGEDFEEFIDVDQDNRLTDSEVIELLKQQLGGKSLEEFSSEEQKRILKTMKQSPGVKNRQLARITGVGFNIIRRL